jgi:hypothetical protein
MTVPMGRAAGVLPRQIQVGSATLDVQPEGETINTGLGRGVRYGARWTKPGGSGKATIDITQTSKMTAEISVGLEAPRGFARLLFGPVRLSRLAELFARALRYDIETRASENADGFEVRRTNAGLVKARSA